MSEKFWKIFLHVVVAAIVGAATTIGTALSQNHTTGLDIIGASGALLAIAATLKASPLD